MAQTQYNLAWQPGASLKQFRADYDANFSTDTEWVFYLRGSYNMTDIRALSVYINNKTNNDLVTVSGNNGQFVRQVPPYGEARLPLADIDVLSLTAPNGQTAIEFYNTPMAESIFQRTDTSTSLIQVSGGLGIATGDLVTIDRIGRLQVADAQPFSANNTTTYFPAGTAFPVYGSITYSANSYARQVDSGALLVMDGGGSGTNYFFHALNNSGLNYQYGTAGYNSGSNAMPPRAMETATRYIFNGWVAIPDQAVYVSKATGAVTNGPVGNAAHLRLLVQPDSLTNDNYFLVSRNGITFYVQECINEIMQTLRSYNTGVTDWTDTGGAWTFKLGRWVGAFTYNPARVNINAIQMTSLANSGDSLQTANATPNTWRGNAWGDPLYVGPCAVMIYRNSSGFPSILYARDAGVSSLYTAAFNVDTVSATRICGLVLDNGDLAVAYNSAAGSIRIKTYDFDSGMHVARLNVTFAIGGTATLLDIVPIPINDTGSNYLLVIYYDGVAVQSFIVNQSLTEIVSYSSPIACGVPNNGWYLWNDADEFAFFVTGSQPTVLQMELAKSVFGVNRGGGSIQMTGFSGINQTFAGSTSFNQNAAAVIGNRGVVFNSTVQLQGLTP